MDQGHGPGQHRHAPGHLGQVAQVGNLPLQLLLGGQELVDRRVEQANGHRVGGHDLEQPLEVGTLQGQQATKGLLAGLRGLGDDHLDDDGQSIHVVEHALGTRQPDPHGAVLERTQGVRRGVGVGHDLEHSELVGPGQQGPQLGGELRLDSGDLAQIDLTAGAVDGDHITLAEAGVAHIGDAPAHVHADPLGTGHAGLAHAAGDHGGVGGLAAAGGEDALGGEEAVDVLGLGLLAHQDHVQREFAPHLLGAVGVEHGDAGGRTRGGGQARGHGCGLDLGVKVGEEHLLQQVRLDAQQGLLLGDQPLADHLHGGAHHGVGVHLAVAGLQGIELAALDGELEVLDLVVVGLEPLPQLLDLAAHLRHLVAQAVDGLGGADAGDHVLALGVDQVLAVELVLAGGRVAGEGHAGGRSRRRGCRRPWSPR